MRRYAQRRDTAERPIIDGLIAAGCQVEQLDYPCDLLWRRGTAVGLLEVKTPKANRGAVMKARQRAQAAFLEAWQVPVVRTLDEALVAVGLRKPPNEYTIRLAP